MAEWIVVNGHVLGQCAYLRSLDKPWEAESPCDCRDLLEDDPLWGSDDVDDEDPAPAETRLRPAAVEPEAPSSG